MKVLELFAGTRSIGKAFEAHGHQVFSVEWDKKFENINLYADIGQLTSAEILEKFGRPDVVWASPDCSSYSIAGIGHNRKLNPITGNLDPKTEYAKFCDNVNQHVIELIKELNPTYWFIENPVGGLRKMAWMKDLPRYTVTYCQYMNPYIKELIFNMTEKKCPKCGEVKPISEFYKNCTRRDGFTVYCKSCISNDSKEYHQRTKEQGRLRLNKWRSAHREQYVAYCRKYREENPEIEFRKQQKYRETHKEKLYLKGKKYREEHRDYFYNKARERKLAEKQVSDGTVTLEYEAFLFDEQNGKCAYCGCDLNESGKHLDHIIPISRGGLHTAHNVHWTCPTCNLSKGDSLEDEWLKKERCKPTDLWTNHPNPRFLPPCHNGDPCHEPAPRGSRTGTQGLKNAMERSRIPDKLCEHIVDICEHPGEPPKTTLIGAVKLFELG